MFALPDERIHDLDDFKGKLRSGDWPTGLPLVYRDDLYARATVWRGRKKRSTNLTATSGAICTFVLSKIPVQSQPRNIPSSEASTPFRLEIILTLARIDGIKRRKVWDHVLERRPSPPKSCKSPLLFSPHVCSPAVKLIGHISDRCFSFQEQNQGSRPSIDIFV